MKLSTSLIALLLSATTAQASSLDVYKDQAFYRYSQQNNFIGFTQGISGICEGTPMAFNTLSICPEEDRLCQVLAEIRTAEQKVQKVTANAKVLDTLISLPKPRTFDAASAIESAKLIGEEQSRLLTQIKILTQDVDIKQQRFTKQAPVVHAMESATVCKKEIELTIPYAHISFSTRYEAELKENNKIAVTQYLSVVNRSGIDISVDRAMFYYRSSSQNVHPLDFTPWIVSKFRPHTRMKRASKSKYFRADEIPVVEPTMSMYHKVVSQKIFPVVRYKDAREYKIENLTLPSTGLPLDFPVLTWDAALSCEIRAYPYKNRQAFHMCSFKPKYQIDNHVWKVKSSSKTINTKAFGEYREGKYYIYTKAEEDIKILRKAIVKKERETGIFGGTARKKDGFSLILTNKSDKEKTLTIIERIPTSVTDEIKVKLLVIKSDAEVNYKILKDGKIEMELTLAGNETKKIDVLFEISYDKDLKVKY